MVPAIAGVGRCANNMGTTSSPTVVRLPHHKAAARNERRPVTALASHVADRDDLVAADTAGRLHFGGVALFLADQRAGDGA